MVKLKDKKNRTVVSEEGLSFSMGALQITLQSFEYSIPELIKIALELKAKLEDSKQNARGDYLG